MDLNTGELFADVTSPSERASHSRKRPKVMKHSTEITPEAETENDSEEAGFDPREVRVYVVGHSVWEQNVFRNQGYRLVYNITDADMVVWLGGADISPALYGETPIKYVTSINPERDAMEIRAWRQAKDKFKAGICRGGQLLNVLNGGRLWQHVEGHTRGPHAMVDVSTGQVIRTSSVHHQAFIPAPTAEIVATANVSTYKESERLLWRKEVTANTPEEVDYEVLYYPESRSLCFQGHPEYSEPKECGPYFFDLIKRYYPQFKKAA